MGAPLPVRNERADTMFSKFKKAVAKQLDRMTKHDHLFRVDVQPDKLWEEYLKAFPNGSNPMMKERTEHDCQACKSFIKAVGNVVAIHGGKKLSVWDVEVGVPHYQAVANHLASLVRKKKIYLHFFRTDKSLGIDFNMGQNEAGDPVRYEHFHYNLPGKFVKRADNVGAFLGNCTASHDVFERGLETITRDALDTVLDLIDQQSVYRGEEFRDAVSAFSTLHTRYHKLKNATQKRLFAWELCMDAPARIRNTVIGTLLVDLSEGKDITDAVNAFEAKVAPSNYKRPKAIITKRMIEDAKKTVKKLGLDTALPRRFATINDITINNVLFADREAKEQMNDDPFDQLVDEIPSNPKRFDKVEEIPIQKFMDDVLPTASSLELQLESRLENNLVSLVAPVNKDAKQLFKWGNGFSWAYHGEVADSDIKRNVKTAGGSVTGVLRFSIQWNENDDNLSDLDAHCREPRGGKEIAFFSKLSMKTGGNLDVDIINPRGVAVENITWPVKEKMLDGVYSFFVNNYTDRGGRSGFRAEIEFEGQVYQYSYDKRIHQGENVPVARVRLHKGQFKITDEMDSTMSCREVWGVTTNNFHRVRTLMYSPNHWDGERTGNRHWFFILEGCKNPDNVRGFFNEFLHPSLEKHRKVFEVLGSKMRTEPSDEQLSGLGFSSTQHNHVLCRVTGSCTRVVKIVF